MMIESTMTVRVSAAVPHCCPMWSSSEEVAGAIHVASCRLSHAGGLVLPWWRCFSPFTRGFESLGIARKPSTVVACAAKGPRPRYARVWKTNRRIGTISKAAKLLQRIKGLSNVKEEVYGALDAFIAWELEFPLIAVRKAINSLEEQKEWKRVIQVIKWMFSKGHGRTMRTYSALLNALAEDGRIEEAGELWTKLFAENLESMPRNLCDRMIAIYYRRDMYSKMFEIFADMEELGIQPNKSIVSMMGKAFRNLGMLDKYAKLKRKYPRPIWKYRYFRGKRVRVRAKNLQKHGDGTDEGAITMSNWSMVQMKQLEGSESISNKDGVVLEEEEDQDPNELSEEVEVISTVETRG